MSRYHTVIIAVSIMVLVAGCLGGQTSSPANESDIDGNGSIGVTENESDGADTDESDNVDDGPNASTEPERVTYARESENGTYTTVVNHASESYNVTLELVTDPPYSDYYLNMSLGIACGGLQDGVYNASTPWGQGNETYTKTLPGGETGTVEGLPTVLQDYKPNDVAATVHAQNGSTLASCDVNKTTVDIST